jgi:hypothetical protein
MGVPQAGNFGGPGRDLILMQNNSARGNAGVSTKLSKIIGKE